MKRIGLLCISLLLVLATVSLPVLAADLAGGYYFVADCVFGNQLKFYVSSDYVPGSLTYDDQGYLFNLSDSNIYLYCPAYPAASIYAQRFQRFKYKAESQNGYVNNYVDAELHNVTDSNIDILVESPAFMYSVDQLLTMILCACLIGIGSFVILRR